MYYSIRDGLERNKESEGYNNSCRKRFKYIANTIARSSKSISIALQIQYAIVMKKNIIHVVMYITFKQKDNNRNLSSIFVAFDNHKFFKQSICIFWTKNVFKYKYIAFYQHDFHCKYNCRIKCISMQLNTIAMYLTPSLI